MAEMTVEQAIELCKRHETYADCFYQINRDDARKIAALLESQQSEINYQNLQIAKLQEDLIKAINGKE